MIAVSLLLAAPAGAATSPVPSPRCETWRTVRMKKGWFQLPDGWELTFAESDWKPPSNFFVRHDGKKARIHAPELEPTQRGAHTSRINEVRACETKMEVTLDVVPWTEGSDRQAIVVTTARLWARYYEAMGERASEARDPAAAAEAFRAAVDADPSLPSTHAALAEALLATGDRAAAVRAIVTGLSVDLPAVYLAVLGRHALWSVIDAQEIVAMRGPSDGDATMADLGLAWSPRLELAARFRVEDGEADVAYGDFLVTPLVYDEPVRASASRADDAETHVLVDRYLRDLGFRAGRRIALPPCGEPDDGGPQERVGCWARAIAKLGVPGLAARLDGQAPAGERVVQLVVDGKPILRGLSRDKNGTYGMIWSIGWLPAQRVLWIEGMYPGPCTVGGAPGSLSFVERHLL
jgi:hypothetical protein